MQAHMEDLNPSRYMRSILAAQKMEIEPTQSRLLFRFGETLVSSLTMPEGCSFLDCIPEVNGRRVAMMLKQYCHLKQC